MRKQHQNPIKKSLAIKAGLLLVALLAGSCSASWHLRKAQIKDPSLFNTNTVRVVDTITVEVPKLQAVFKYKHDTVRITKDSVRIKYFYNTKDSTVFVEADCPDNKVVTNTVTNTKTIKVLPTFWQKAAYGFKSLLILLIVIIVGWFLLKILKPKFW